MPAPRLLDKKLVNASLAQERKQEIEKGKKIAQAVDAIRETRTKEEFELEQFRKESIAKIQIEINAKLAEKDALIPEINRLKEERIQAQAPLNLKEEWSRVRQDAEANRVWQERNTQDSIDLLAREEEHRTFAAKNEKESEEIQEEHKLSLRTLSEAESKFAQAEDALARAECQAQQILENAHERENHLRVREEDATAREVELSARERAIESHETDLSNREIKLKSRQETFMKAQAYIKSKKK